MGRFNSKQLEIIIPYLIARDGQFCQKCKKSLAILKTKVRVDHKDNDKNNTESSNLRLLCHSCNIVAALETKLKLVTDSEKQAPIELRLGSKMEKKFIAWLVQKLDQDKKIKWHTAIYQGAMEVNASRETVKGYLFKHTSGHEDCVFETKEEWGDTYIKLTQEYRDYFLEIEDLK